MGGMSRRKGKVGEREACAALAEVWPGLKRVYGQARMGSDAPDIDAPGCPVWVEVKRGERINVHQAMNQALMASAMNGQFRSIELKGMKAGEIPTLAVHGVYRPPVIVHRRSRGEWLVTMRASDLGRVVGR